MRNASVHCLLLRNIIDKISSREEELYIFQKRKMEKKSILFYDAEAEAFWEKVIGDDDARPITELIKSPGIFRL